MITTVLLSTGSSLNIEENWIWDKYSLFTDGPYTPYGGIKQYGNPSVRPSVCPITLVHQRCNGYLRTLIGSPILEVKPTGQQRGRRKYRNGNIVVNGVA